jgi:hypothetical protein
MDSIKLFASLIIVAFVLSILVLLMLICIKGIYFTFKSFIVRRRHLKMVRPDSREGEMI